MDIVFILFGALARLLPHVPNFTPIGALALFGAAYRGRRFALLVPLAAMTLSDVVIGGHTTLPYVYASFALIALMGTLVFRNGVSTTKVVGASLASSGILYLVSNFGVWAAGTLYPRSLDGLVMAYVMGIPYLRSTIVGDLFYAGIMFGGYALARHFAANRTPALETTVTKT